MSKLLPSLQAATLTHALTEYLTTTFDLTDKETRQAAEAFITDPDNGIFHGPYLNLTLPYAPGQDNTQEVFDWYEGYPPYAHQTQAFARLTSKNHTPQPTLITTGTGSGKTESFLYPILDHINRVKSTQPSGIKALIIYPMNALAADQASRLAHILADHPELTITAGIYTGEHTGEHTRVTHDGLINNRTHLRSTPPDILLTNYKMLDQLLLRPDDATLWAASADTLQYLVLDEFHTYDGAQGTDVAMLLRRLGHTLNRHRTTPAPAEHPLGPVTPIATSATLSTDDDPHTMLNFAETVFAQPFHDDALVTDTRLTHDDWKSGARTNPEHTHHIDAIAYRADDANIRIQDWLDAHPATTSDNTTNVTTAGNTTNATNNSTPDTGSADYARRIASAVCYALYSPTDRTPTPSAPNPDDPHHATWAWDLTNPTTPDTLVAIAQTHPTLDALIHTATTAPRGSIALQDLARTLFPLPPSRRGDDTTWATEANTYLNYLLALLSYIRTNTNRATHPTPNINIHLWLRELSRIDRQITNTATFRWSDDGPVTDPKQWRPAIYCRSCGRSGWGIVMAPNSTTEPDHRANPRKASLTHDPNFRALISASPEAKHYFDTHEPNPRLQWYNTSTNELSPQPPETNQDPDYQNGIILPVLIDHTLGKAHDICPNCGSMHSIRFLGSAIATQLSVTLSSLFGDDNLDTNEKKTLVFTDSVQDAAHRSSFIQTRSHAMNFRTTLRGNMGPTPTPLPNLIHHIVANATTPHQRYRLLPPDLDDHPDFQKFYSPNPSRTIRTHMEDRLLFDALLEFGTNSRYGRTLELTGTATVTINTHGADLTALGHAAHHTARELYPSQDPVDGTSQPPNYQAWVHGTLHRIRTQGGIHHKYLNQYLKEDGNRWSIWGGRKRHAGAPAFPRDRQTPAFPYLPGHRPHNNDNLHNAINPNSWYTTWTSKCLGIPTKDATYATRALLETLAEAGILHETISTTGSRIYGLLPNDILVSPTQLDTTSIDGDSDSDGTATNFGDGTTTPQLLECSTCGALHPAGGGTLTALTDAPCPNPGCPGTLHPTPIDPNYYQQLYSSHNPQSVISSEHTSLLEPADRARIENGFKGISATSDPTAPNVLVATPTLEMGIDIGDLSTVILSSLPNSVASYQQRVGRAGRAHGNALLLTYVRGRGTNLPKLHNPLSVIAGDVQPPAIFLSAQEILQRQFLAYLLDHLAATTPPHSPSRPGTIQGLFGNNRGTTWLDLAEDELAHNATHHLDTFLASFPNLSPGAQTYLRNWATPHTASDTTDNTTPAPITPLGETNNQRTNEPTLHNFLTTARDTWNTHVADLTTKLAILQDTFDTLETQLTHDPNNSDLRRAYYSTRADLKATRNALHDHTTEPWINGLERAGLLPNYTLLDDDVTLDVNITLPRGAEGGFTADTRTYTRSKSNALREFAPGNTFYAHGYEITIDSVELGTRTSNIERWQICPQCGHVEIRTQGDTTPLPTSCPTCHSTTFCDPGQHIDVVELSQVSASISAQNNRIGDKDDERRQKHNIITILPDTQPGTITHSWHTPHTRFGVDFLRNTTVRWLNLGTPTNGAGHTIAGTEYRSDLFRLCSECGHIDHKAGENRPTEHKPWCSLRTTTEEHPVTVALSRTLHTQAVILHIPIDFDHNTFVIPSLTAAIQLGLRETLGGTPQHLDIVPVPDTLYHNGHQALMIVDIVPGGTGYLADFSNPATIHAALTTARTILRDCPCQHDEQDACHNCLLPFAGTNGDVSRTTALDALNRILGINDTDPTPTLDEWQPTEGLLDTPEYNPASSLEGEFYNAFINRLRDLKWTVDERPGNSLPYATITSPNRDEWELLSQVSMDRVMPDFVLYHRSSTKDGKRIRHRHGDGEICIFLDGREYHATRTHNRVDDDAIKRHYLRSQGATVWAITHRDVLDFRNSFHGKTLRTSDPTPRATRARDALHNLQPHFHAVGIDSTLKHVMDSDPITQLIAYIDNPKANLWQELGKRLPLTSWQPTCTNHLDLTPHHGINTESAITSTPLSNASYTLQTTTPLMAHINHFATTGTVALPTTTQWSASDSPIFAEPHLVWATNLGTPGLILAARVPANTLKGATTYAKHLPGLEYMLLLDSNSDALELDNGEAWRQWLRLSNLLGLANDTNAVYIGTLHTARNGTLPGGRSYSHWLLNHQPLPTPAETLPPAWQEALDLALDDDEAQLITALCHANIPLPTQGEELSNGTPVDMVWDQHHAFTFRPTPGDDIDARELLDAGWTLLPYNADDIINYFTKPAKENTR